MYDLVLKLLRAFICDEEPIFEEKVNISELLKCAYYQKFLGIFAYMAKKYKLLGDEYTADLNKAYYAAVTENALRTEAFERLSLKLSENGVEHMPVKGYFLRELYPVKELRSFGDIDVLIHAHDREKCDRIMREAGYAVKNDWEPTYSYLKGKEYYELHTNLFDVKLKGKADMEEYFSRAWQFAEKRDGLMFEPNKDFHFIYTVCHTAKHLSSGGAGMRMHLDIALFIKKFDGELNWAYIKEEFKKIGLLRFLYVVLGAASEWFGITASCEFERPDEKLLSALLSYTLGADIYGKTRDNALVKLSKDNESSKLALFFKMLFPSREVLVKRYTFLERSPLLLPVAWVVRVFKNFSLIPEKLRFAKKLKLASQSEAKGLDIFMEKLGL